MSPAAANSRHQALTLDGGLPDLRGQRQRNMKPKGWEHHHFAELFRLKHGFAFSSEGYANEGTYILVTPGNFFEEGGFRHRGQDEKYFVGQIPSEYILNDNDLLVVMTEQAEGLLGSTAFVPAPEKYLHNQRLGRVVDLNTAKLTKRYLKFLLNSLPVRRQISVSASGTKVRHTSPDKIGEVEVCLPPLPEQQKIAEILGTWDEALEQLDALIAAKDRRKQALMQQLLTGKLRMPGFQKPWEKHRFGELMKGEDRYATFNDDHLYHLVSARRRAEGVFFREALHGREILTKVMKQVRAGDFLISRMQVVHGGLGIVPPECDDYYASDSYEVLVQRDANKLSPRFIGHLCRTRRFWHRTLICSHGVHIEKMTFVMSDFEKEKFSIPEITEQVAIADILDAADAELRLLRQQRAALDHQRRGLMQQLLSGKVRVST